MDSFIVYRPETMRRLEDENIYQHELKDVVTVRLDPKAAFVSYVQAPGKLASSIRYRTDEEVRFKNDIVQHLTGIILHGDEQAEYLDTIEDSVLETEYVNFDVPVSIIGAIVMHMKYRWPNTWGWLYQPKTDTLTKSYSSLKKTEVNVYLHNVYVMRQSYE